MHKLSFFIVIILNSEDFLLEKTFCSVSCCRILYFDSTNLKKQCVPLYQSPNLPEKPEGKKSFFFEIFNLNSP